jgi:hypothetical protein
LSTNRVRFRNSAGADFDVAAVTSAERTTLGAYVYTYEWTSGTSGTISLYRDGVLKASTSSYTGSIGIKQFGTAASSSALDLNGEIVAVSVWSGRALNAQAANEWCSDPFEMLRPVKRQSLFSIQSGNTFNETASGGALCAGSAAIQFNGEEVIQGGDTCAGVVDIQCVYSIGTSGGTVCGGTAIESVQSGTISISSPSGVKCYQRNGSNQHSITVSGTYTGAPTAVEYRFAGGSWATLDAAPAGGNFTGTAILSKGQGTIDVRFANATGTTASCSTITVGDVFVIAGQSNAEGRIASQTHVGTYTLVSFREDDAWRLNNSDPTDTGSSGRSYWPKLADYIEADQDVPVILITTADGGTGLVNPAHWQGANYTNMTAQITQSGVNGVKAVLWYQGETDVLNSVTENDYYQALKDLSDDIAVDIVGSPPICALQLGYTGAALNGIRKAIARNWDDGLKVFGGPTFYDKSGDTHPVGAANIQATVERYWAALKEKFYGGATGVGRGPKIASASFTAGRTKVEVKFNKTLKTGLTFGTAAWAVADGGGAVTVSSVAYHTTATDTVVLTLGTAAVGSTTVSLGSGTSAVGIVVPLGPDFVLPGGAGTTNLPAEPFFGEGVANAVYNETVTGGCVCAGQSATAVTYNVSKSGGVLASGGSSGVFNETATGGVIVGASAALSQFNTLVDALTQLRAVLVIPMGFANAVTTWIPGRDGRIYELRNGEVIEVLPGEAYYLRTRYPEIFQ